MHINAQETKTGRGAKDNNDSFCSSATGSGNLGFLES